jgi:hypothetical protein
MDPKELALKKFTAIRKALAATFCLAKPSIKPGQTYEEFKKSESNYFDLLAKAEPLFKAKIFSFKTGKKLADLPVGGPETNPEERHQNTEARIPSPEDHPQMHSKAPAEPMGNKKTPSRAKQLGDIARAAEKRGITINRATHPDHAKAIAIHLYRPSVSEVEKAVEDAHAKGHKQIYLHGSKKTWGVSKDPSKAL